MKKKKLTTYVEVDDTTPIQKLSVSNQLRVLIQRLTHDDADDFAAEDAVEVNRLRLQADLMNFIHKSTEPIRMGKKRRVVMSISNTFDPVLEQVLNSNFVKNYYSVIVRRPEIEYNIHYFLEVELEVLSY